MLFSGEIYTADKILTLPRAVTAATNLTSGLTKANPESQIDTLRCQIDIKTQDPLKKFKLSELLYLY